MRSQAPKVTIGCHSILPRLPRPKCPDKQTNDMTGGTPGRAARLRSCPLTRLLGLGFGLLLLRLLGVLLTGGAVGQERALGAERVFLCAKLLRVDAHQLRELRAPRLRDDVLDAPAKRLQVVGVKVLDHT